MERFENAKIGDEVFCEVYGDGNIVRLQKESTYPVVVEFSSEYRESYTRDGRIRKEAINPTLFYRKGAERNLTERPTEEIDWKEWEGKEILVRESTDHSWKKKRLYHYQPEFNLRFACYDERAEIPISWKYAKLIEAVEEKPQEIDWTKVATGTQVIVSDSENFYPCNSREFFTYRPDLEYKFWIFDGEKDEAYGYKYCKIV